MTDPVPADDATLFPKSAGERLREAREAQGLSLAEIAARTRVPLRQLEAIENDNFAGLPSVTYAVGFAKAYARAVGVDEVSIARDVRSQNDIGVRRTEYEQYEIKEPSRTPSGMVVAVAAIAVVLLLLGVGLWYGTSLFRGDGAAQTAVAPAATTEIMPPAPVAAPIPAAVQGGQVVLTATDEVWMRVYDAAGKTLFQNTLKPGERYEVPADADGPMINVGRPDKLQVTINGSAVPPLGDGRLAIKDVAIGAAALQGRGAASASQPAPEPSPAAGASRTTSAGAVPPAFRTPSRSTPSQPQTTRRASVPVVTRPNGGSPAEVAPAPAPGAPAPTAAPPATTP